MKKIIALIAFAFTVITASAQEKEIIGNHFELKGKMICDVVMSPPCGILASAVVVEFQILEVSDGTLPPGNVGIIFTCPELFGKDFFKNGETYTITVADKNQASNGWLIANEEALDKYSLPNKLYAVKAEKVD